MGAHSAEGTLLGTVQAGPPSVLLLIGEMAPFMGKSLAFLSIELFL